MHTVPATVSSSVSGRRGILKERLFALDAVRGWVMIFMALDHAMYFCYIHIFAEGSEGIRPESLPDVAHYLTRFITHYCAPTFIFLAGISVALYAVRRRPQCSEGEITRNLFTRGILLIALQLTIVNWVWEFGFRQYMAHGIALTYVGILSCIGCGLLVLAFARRLPLHVLATSSVLLLLVVPFLLVLFPVTPGTDHILLEVLLQPNSEGWLFVKYPVLPWLGVLGLGCTCGLFIRTNPEKITKFFLFLGVIMLVSWLGLRLGSGYGNITVYQGGDWRDFLLMSKYPPSLVFLLWNLGGMAIAIAVHNYCGKTPWFKQLFKVITLFGQTPLFFYVVHLWVYRTLSFTPVRGTLLTGYAAWVLGLVVMIPLCYGFRSLKRKYPQSVLQYV
jgi:uncharacterized membrane protein